MRCAPHWPVLTANPKYIFNTHFHGDHTGGNRAFGQHATILAHINVRKRLATGGEFGKRHVEPAPAVALPNIAFEQSASVFFNDEEIRAVHFPRAHTDGDIAVFFVNAQIAHLSDLFFNGIFPFVDLEYGGDVETLTQHIAVLIDQLPADAKIIPGHGPVATLDDLKAYHRMLVETTASVRTRRDAGMSLDQISAEGLDPQWASWEWSFVPAQRWIEIVYWSLEVGAESD